MHQNFVMAHFYFSLTLIIIIIMIIAIIVIIINKVFESLGNSYYRKDYYSYSVKIIIINNINLIMIRDAIKLAYYAQMLLFLMF